MAICYNKNTKEYKTLQGEFKSPYLVDSIIRDFQTINKNDSIPTIDQAKEVINDIKSVNKITNKKAIKTIYDNLVSKGYVYQRGNKYYVTNNSIKLAKIASKYLQAAGFPKSTLTVKKGANITQAIVNESLDYSDLIYNINTDKDKTHTISVLDELTKRIPGLRYAVMDVKSAQALYNQLPEEAKSDVPFDEVKSFFYDGSAILIRGRVTNAIALEEVLHPVVESFYLDDPELFNKLLKEAAPEIVTEVNERYSAQRGFSQKERDLEVVTKTLQQHFSGEKRANTRSFIQAISDFLKWFAETIRSLYKKISGKTLNLSDTQINSSLTLSDIAKKLNTDDLTFVLNPRALRPEKIRYALSGEKKRVLDTIKKQGNDLQSMMVDTLFHGADISKNKFDDLAAAQVVFKDGKYINVDIDTKIEKDREYTPARVALMGTAFQSKFDIEQQLGEDLEKILNAAVIGTPYEKIEKTFTKINKGDTEVKAMYEDLVTRINTMRDDRSIFVPGVVIADHTKKIADTVHILKIDRFGNLFIINLRTGKFSRNSKAYKTNLEQLGNDSIFYSELLAGMTPRMQDNMRMSLQRRMFENLGFVVSDEAMTLHIHKKKNNYIIERTTLHDTSENVYTLDKVIPESIDEENASVIDQIMKINRNPEEDVLFDDFEVDETYEIGADMYDALVRALTDFRKGLISREQALTNARNVLQMDKSRAQMLKEVGMTRTLIEQNINDPDEIVRIYFEIVNESIAQIKEFKEYIGNPDNFSKPEYIRKVLSWQKFVESYRGLANVAESKGLSTNQKSKIIELINELNTLVGVRRADGTIVESGQFDLAIKNYIKQFVRDNSNQDFDNEDLEELMNTAKDIGWAEGNLYDLDGSSDTLLALMAKKFKHDQQTLKDRVESWVPRIQRATLKLKQANGGTLTNAFDFMIQRIDGKMTGRYVQKIGHVFHKTFNDLYSLQYDKDGGWMNYIEIDDLDDATEEQLEYNKKLYKIKQDLRNFKRAEIIDEHGYRDGNNYKYTDEFKRARRQNEVFVKTANGGYWTKRESVSDKDFNEYLHTYFDHVTEEDQVHIAIKDGDGQFTGQTYILESGTFVKQEFKEIREESAEGVDYIDPKYKKLMDPQTALEQAQTEYYNMFIDIYENNLMKLLPENVKMIGKIPRIMGRVTENLDKNSNVVGELFSRMKTSVKDFFTTTSTVKKAQTDEFGNIITDSLPIYYSGTLSTQESIEKTEALIDTLTQEYQAADTFGKKRKIGKELRHQKSLLNNLKNKPSSENLNTNLSESLLAYAAMAENYEVKAQAEDTYKAFLHIIKDRDYTDSGGNVKINDEGKEVGTGRGRGQNSRTYQRALKWMKMVYYNNDNDTKTWFDKFTKGLITTTSLAYVGFNIFGNINNYVMARTMNAIETAGERFFKRSAMFKATARFNKRLPRDIMSGLANNLDGDRKWKDGNNRGKYLAVVQLLRMMDDKKDIRESNIEADSSSVRGTAKDMFSDMNADNVIRFSKAAFDRFHEIGYVLQDAGEFNVQTKVGQAIVESTTMKNSKTGETLSLYDAFSWDSTKLELKLKDGFDTVIFYNPGTPKLHNKEFLIGGEGHRFKTFDDVRKELRNYIREVNKQIHGNYAHEDRMVIQSHALGQLAAQFHKWVVPAWKARFRPEYFDENLGWMQGRYLTFFNFMKYFFKNIGHIGSIASDYKEFNGEKGMMKLQNVNRVLGEMAIIMIVFMIKSLLGNMFGDDDDENRNPYTTGQKTQKGAIRNRLENALLYQASRLHKELILFSPLVGVPVYGGGLQQMYQMWKSPLASTRTLGELGQALEMTIGTGLAYAWMDDEKFKESEFVYKRGNRKGQIKLRKEWGDALPILYTINRWKSYDRAKDFYIK